MTPLWLRFLLLGIGAALFFGSWFVGNSVDAAEPAARTNRAVLLQKDAITFFMRVAGALAAVLGLLMWVAAGPSHSLF